ncbi:metal-sensitive transcriptional regulator [Jeotgalibaca sp. MA1X17-3]|nr:metal-sensitive transcriptional regulator [Jeotgalibaca sp. MA1X17-3]UJF16306.1 metal-sensitive transcriptional regulator [Jeotgalibaca sp. MA1X17-3]
MKIRYDKKIVNRLKKSEGQMRGVLNMMDTEKDCKEVVTQLTAIRSSIDKAIGLIVAENLVQCISDENSGLTSEEAVQEAIHLLVKTR